MNTVQYKQGQTGTYSGFRAVIVRQYDGMMYEMRLPGGLICADVSYFIPD